MKSKQHTVSKKPSHFKSKPKAEKYVWVRLFEGCCPWQISGMPEGMGGK